MPQRWGDMTALRAAAECLTDAIKTRIQAENRAQRGGAAIDAEHRDRLVAIPRDAEDETRALLHSLYEEVVPDHIREWAAGIPGLRTGEVFPRLIGLTGNPRQAIPYKWDASGSTRVLVPDGEPFQRSLRQLWQWAGCGDPEVRPVAGMGQAELLRCGRRTDIRPVLFAFTSYIARAGRIITKEDSPRRGQPVSQEVANSRYFKIFCERKAEGLGRTHAWECQNHKRPPYSPNGCGTVAHREWGEIGSPWRAGHAEMHAHRITAKELLRDLWIQSE